MNIELTLDDILEFEGTDMVIGNVEEVYVDEECLKDGHAGPGEAGAAHVPQPGAVSISPREGRWPRPSRWARTTDRSDHFPRSKNMFLPVAESGMPWQMLERE